MRERCLGCGEYEDDAAPGDMCPANYDGYPHVFVEVDENGHTPEPKPSDS